MTRKPAKCFSFRQDWREPHPLERRSTRVHGFQYRARLYLALGHYNTAIKPALGTDSSPKSSENPTRIIKLSSG